MFEKLASLYEPYNFIIKKHNGSRMLTKVKVKMNKVLQGPTFHERFGDQSWAVRVP